MADKLCLRISRESQSLSYTITGGAARHEKVKPKTWRIFTFADDNWYHHHGYWYHRQLVFTTDQAHL